MMKVFQGVFLVAAIVGLAGCSSGIQVLQKPDKGQRLAIVMFDDCSGATDCSGSGKKVSDFYSEILKVPVVMFDTDTKGYDLFLTGKVLNYNEAVPFAFNSNIVHVDLNLKKVADGSDMIIQQKLKMGSNVTSSTKELSEELAEDLKDAME